MSYSDDGALTTIAWWKTAVPALAKGVAFASVAGGACASALYVGTGLIAKRDAGVPITASTAVLAGACIGACFITKLACSVLAVKSVI